MGTRSYVLVGTPHAMAESFGSSCHEAGCRLSRHAAKRQDSGSKLKADLEAQEIVVRSGSMSGLAEEAPTAYKDDERQSALLTCIA
jgi:tRNA-splicing ligase RtcB (3'-phosphate/5'-hydroxy nucleic acid ligase)